ENESEKAKVSPIASITPSYEQTPLIPGFHEKTELEIAVHTLSLENVRQLEELILNNALFSFASSNSPISEEKKIAVLEQIVANGHLFTNPKFLSYSKQLLENLRN